MANPMEQFAVKTVMPLEVAGYDVSFTNSSLWMVIALAAVSAFLFVGTARPQLVPGRLQAATEYLYDFVRKMMDENVGPEGRRYAPHLVSGQHRAVDPPGRGRRVDAPGDRRLRPA